MAPGKINAEQDEESAAAEASTLLSSFTPHVYESQQGLFTLKKMRKFWNTPFAVAEDGEEEEEPKFLFAIQREDKDKEDEGDEAVVDPGHEDGELKRVPSFEVGNGGFWSQRSLDILEAAPDAEYGSDRESLTMSSGSGSGSWGSVGSLSDREEEEGEGEEWQGEESWVLPSLIIERPTATTAGAKEAGRVPKRTVLEGIEEEGTPALVGRYADAVGAGSRASAAGDGIGKTKKSKGKGKEKMTPVRGTEAERKARLESEHQARLAELTPWLQTLGLDPSDPALLNLRPASSKPRKDKDKDKASGRTEPFEPGFTKHCRKSFITRYKGYPVDPKDEWTEMPVGCLMPGAVYIKDEGTDGREAADVDEDVTKEEKQKERSKKKGIQKKGKKEKEKDEREKRK